MAEDRTIPQIFVHLEFDQIAKTAINEFNKEVKELVAVGKKLPDEKWDQRGIPEMLKGAVKTYWAGYIPKANISFVPEKNRHHHFFRIR